MEEREFNFTKEELRSLLDQVWMESYHFKCTTNNISDYAKEFPVYFKRYFDEIIMRYKTKVL